MKVFSPFLNGNTTTSGSFNVPNHPSTASIQNPLTGSLFHDDTDGILKVYTGTQWQVVGEQAFEEAVASANIEYLLVAGGGGGGAGYSTSTIGGGGGGGAGGYLSSSLSSIESGSSITVTIGSGGTGQAIGTGNSTAGSESSIASAGGTSFTTATANGGGRGGSYANTSTGGDGGSGGGSAYNNAAAGSGTIGQGFDGGQETNSTPGYGNGGGGGASEVGSDGTGTAGGDGGDGRQSAITGTSTYHAGGGGGGIGDGDDGDGGAGGQGGGGTGGEENISGTAGTVNTGGGGGGGGNDGVGSSAVTSTGAAGGSGVVILAYESGSINAAGGIVGDAGNGRKYHQFNASDTFKIGSTSDFQIVTSNLVSHFDAGDFTSRGTSTWTDLSGNGYNLTATSSPSLGNNFYYDFSTSYFTRTDSAHEFTNGNFTIEVWVKFDSLSAGDTIASKRSTGNPGNRNWLLGHDSNGLVYFIQYHSSSQNTYPQTGNGVVTTGTWHHITVTGDASTMKIYVDGTQEATTSFTTTGAWGTGSPLELARRGTNSGYKYLDGQIAQFRAYSSGLTASEVLQNYNATKTNFI